MQKHTWKRTHDERLVLFSQPSCSFPPSIRQTFMELARNFRNGNIQQWGKTFIWKVKTDAPLYKIKYNDMQTHQTNFMVALLDSSASLKRLINSSLKGWSMPWLSKASLFLSSSRSHFSSLHIYALLNRICKPCLSFHCANFVDPPPPPPQYFLSMLGVFSSFSSKDVT